MEQTKLSNEQQDILNNFRQHLIKQNLSIQQYPDKYLLKFCIARKWVFKDIIEMWNNFVKWTIEVDFYNSENFEYQEIDEVRQEYPHGYQGLDKEGYPIYIEKLGNVNLDKLFTITSQERYIKYQIQAKYILLHKIFPVLESKKEQVCVIIDLKGISYSNFNSKVINFIKLTNDLSSNYFPELLRKMYIINAPSIFSMIWSAIKGRLDEGVKKKISIIGQKYIEELQQTVLFFFCRLTFIIYQNFQVEKLLILIFRIKVLGILKILWIQRIGPIKKLNYITKTQRPRRGDEKCEIQRINLYLKNEKPIKKKLHKNSQYSKKLIILIQEQNDMIIQKSQQSKKQSPKRELNRSQIFRKKTLIDDDLLNKSDNEIEKSKLFTKDYDDKIVKPHKQPKNEKSKKALSFFQIIKNKLLKK